MLLSPWYTVTSLALTPLIVVVWPLQAAAYTGVLPVLPFKVRVVPLNVHDASYGYASKFATLLPTTNAATGTSFPCDHDALRYLSQLARSVSPVQISWLSLIVAVPQRTMTACLSPVIVEFSMFKFPGTLNNMPALSLLECNVVNLEFWMFISTLFPVVLSSALVDTT